MQQGFRTAQQQTQALEHLPNLDQYKRDFAYHYLRMEKKQFDAALKVFPINRAMAMQAANYWPSDPQVIMHMEELVKQLGEEAFLPTKADFLKEVWGVMKSPRVEAKDRAKMAEIYAKARGFFPEKESAVKNEINVVNKVMVVPCAGTNDEWEQRLARQQQALVQQDAD